MAHRVCPYWVGYWLASPLRRLMHNPDKIVRPFVTAGMTVVDVGSAMGFFSFPLARMVGPDGKVVCVDVQEKMLQSLRRRALKAQMSERIVARVCEPASLGLDDFEGTIDFVLAFAVVHEVPDARALFADIFKTLKPGARCLVAEPKGHVSLREFKETLAAAEQAGFRVTGNPGITGCHTALLSKEGGRCG